MRYAILSDIHSNLEALTAVLVDMASKRVDRTLCLGDLIGYGADPEGCLNALQQAEALCVAGNHEYGCIGKLDDRWFNDAARRAVLWTRDRLSFTDLDWLRRLPLVAKEDGCTLVHGTLSHPERFEYLVDLAQAVDTARMCETTYCLVGHTHVPFVCEYDRRQGRMGRIFATPNELAEASLAGETGSIRCIINPGSVGQPRDGDPRASYAILDTEAHMLTVHRVAYDIPRAQEKIRSAGLPEFLADRLAVGR